MSKQIHTHANRVAQMLAVLLVLGAGNIVTFAQTPTEDPVIYACVSRGLIGLGKGAIRIVDGPNKCTAAEDPLFWHQTADAAIASAITIHEAKTLYAVVGEDGTIVRSSPGVTTTNFTPQTASYVLDMGRDISGCTPSVTLGLLDGRAVRGFASASFNPFLPPSSLVVLTFQATSQSIASTPSGFFLLVTCP